ncbi:MAG: carboxypeptidase-like regulatory domain-containing protein, partial [Cyclobacteriaceae bacterium]
MSNYRSLMVAVCLFLGGNVMAQEDIAVTGSVVDSKTGEAVIGATVYFINVRDSLDSKFGTTDVEGNFIVKNMPRAFYKLEIRSIGYKTYQQVLRITQSAQMAPISMAPDVKQLDEVVVEAEQAVQQKGDTTVYRADS